MFRQFSSTRQNALSKAGLGKLVQKGKLTSEEAAASLSRVKTSDSFNESVRDADLVIEAVFENLELKQKIFKDLEKQCKPTAILGSNTSALPITEIASVTKSGSRVIGIHFMNPVPLMRGVEIIRGQLTSDETMAATTEYVKRIGKEPIVAIDYAGFIVSRLVDVLMNEAVKMVQEGNRPEDIDRAMELCAGHPDGPLQTSRFGWRGNRDARHGNHGRVIWENTTGLILC